MPDELEHEIIRQLVVMQEQQSAMQAQQSVMATDLAVVKSKAHSPQDCPLAKQVRDLTIQEARRGGVFAVVGLFAVAGVTFLFNWLFRFVAR